MVITTWRAVKTNHAETPSKIKTTPKKIPANHFKMLNGFTLGEGRLERKEMGSIFTGFDSIFLRSHLISAYNRYPQCFMAGFHNDFLPDIFVPIP